MISTWQRYAARLDALDNRRRALVFCAGLVVLLVIVGLGAIEPFVKRTATLRQELRDLHTNIATSTAQKQALEAQLAIPPDTALQQQLADVDGRIRSSEEELRSLSQGMVKPQHMSALVGEVVAKTPGIVLEGLRTLPAEPVVTPEPNTLEPPRTQTAADAGLYRHGIEIVVRGTYPALIEYCRRLERLPVRAIWKQTRIDASRYPSVVMTLSLFTLSLERTWMTL